LLAITIVLLLLVSPAGTGYSAHAAAEDQLSTPVPTTLGTFGGIAYVQYDGIFEGQTSTGAYRVPYRIIAPANPSHGNQTVIVEPPHFVEGLGTLKIHLGKEFLLSRGFAYAGVGWSTTTDFGFGIFRNRILDPDVPGVFINGGFDEFDGRTDDEIIVDFARALVTDSDAQWMLGSVERRYIAGFSDTSDPILRLVTSGHAAGVFDFAFPFTLSFMAQASDPQTAITDNLYGGKLIIVNSEFEGPSTELVDRNSNPNQYRFYAVAGTPHIPDPLMPPDFSMTSPASFQPALRAHFLQGDAWVQGNKQPPLSTSLKSSGGDLVRDANGNAITVDAKGKSVPRLPFIELGEARFTYDEFPPFLGIYDNVKPSSGLNFKNHAKYLKAFENALKAYVKAGYMLQEDADVMLRRAALCPSKTFTEVYRDHYQNFVNVQPCG
jgi:hypothetical protein